MLKRLPALAGALVLVLGLAGCGSDDGDDNAADASDSASASSEPTESDSASEAPETDAPAGDAACTYTPAGEAAKPVDLPPETPTVTEPVEVTIETSAGELNATLNGDTTPCTVNSFLSLAEQGFYDDTPCPRITTDPGFELLQCGDPTGTTAGGPGYQFDDELTGSETYTAGTLAMANSGPGTGTNGSQFFIVYGDAGLSPDYTVFGTVDADDLPVIEGIAADGDDGSNPAGGGAPNTPIDIVSVTVD